MKTLVLLIIASALVVTKQCQNKDRKNDQQESAFEREERLVDEYHKQVVISKGKETFFIPKEEIHWYFNKGEFLPVANAQVDDNVSFFDTLGNIEYQAIVVSRKADKTIIKCQDLSNAEYYNTELNPDSVRDLKKDYPYLIKVYRLK